MRIQVMIHLARAPQQTLWETECSRVPSPASPTHAIRQQCLPWVLTRWAWDQAGHQQLLERDGKTNSPCPPWPPCFRRWSSSCRFRLDPWEANKKNLQNPSELETVQLPDAALHSDPLKLWSEAWVRRYGWPLSLHRRATRCRKTGIKKAGRALPAWSEFSSRAVRRSRKICVTEM